VARYLLAGADVVMTASALLRHEPGYAGVLLEELSGWMARKGFRAVGEARGLLSVPAGADATGYERAGYVTALQAANRHKAPGDRLRLTTSRPRRPGRCAAVDGHC